MKDERTGLRFIAASELAKDLGPTDWQIRGILEANTLATVYGPPDTLKSFLVLDWALCSTADLSWHGHKIKHGPVLALIGEGRNGYMRRIHAWCLHQEQAIGDLPLFVSSAAGALTDAMGRAELEAVVGEFMMRNGAPVMVLIDTLARNFGPGDENSSRDMGAAIDACAAIRDMTGAAVVLVHHSGKDATKGARGSIALLGAVDAEYSMARQPDGTVILTCQKMKDAPKPDPMAFQFQQVDIGILDEEGDPVTSGVLAQTEHASRPTSAADRIDEVRAWKAQGKTIREASDITGIPRSNVGRLFKKIDQEAEAYRDAHDGF